ncbi:MAG: sulfotransferase [Parvularculaceae bacterium]
MPSAALISACALVNSLLRGVQNLLWSTRVGQQQIVAPVFIVGHWRSGTSLLHELLAIDPAHVAPTTYECFFPHHFLLTESWLPKLIAAMLPAHRPMDNMRMAWDGPLEDEYGLCSLGEPSPYVRTFFPNGPAIDRATLDMERVSRAVVERWQRTLLRFLREMTVRTPGRVLLKSPPHSFRIPALLNLFPDARFVHIVRDPFVVFPSTMNLWRRLYRLQGLQEPKFERLEEDVLDTYLHLFERIDGGRALVAASHFFEVRYEDLIADPLGRLRAMYRHLDLGDFDRVAPRVEGYLKDARDYKTNRYQLRSEERATIAERWKPVIERYGYAVGVN